MVLARKARILTSMHDAKQLVAKPKWCHTEYVMSNEVLFAVDLNQSFCVFFVQAEAERCHLQRLQSESPIITSSRHAKGSAASRYTGDKQ